MTITKEDVLKPIINAYFDWDSEGVIGVGIMATHLKTTKYQIRKQIKALLGEGLIVHAIRKGGFDEYSCMPYPPYKGYKITNKAKSLPIFAELKAIQEKIFAECFGFSGAFD